MTRGATDRLAFTPCLAAAAAAALTTFYGPLPAAAQPAPQNFYAGKQLTIIVGSAVGGGYDHLARLVGRHIGKHLPGEPGVVVQNMPAAGGLAAANHGYNAAPKDGTTIVLVQRGMLLANLTNPSGVRYQLDKFNWLGSLNSEVAVTAAWHTAPHKTAKDLFNTELVTGATKGIDPETTPVLYNSLLGTKFKIVLGYTGTTQIALAMERGEVQAIGDWSLSSLKVQRPDWIRDKKVTLLLQGALKKEPELGDLPSALDFVKNDSDRKVLELHFSQKTVARPMLAPPDIPADRLAALRKAFMALGKDQGFLADAERSKLEISLIDGEEVERIVRMITATPPEVADRFAKAFQTP